MKVLGLILELNPFHNGHKYFIDKAKELVKPDLVVGIISSSFTMRGEISVIDKFTKTNLCLDNGIDLIIELPLVYTLASADTYAYNAIYLLNNFGITDLCFGSEIGEIDKLINISKIEESESFNTLIKNYLDKGNSYPNSAMKALMDLKINSNDVIEFTKPNNTLALSYIKAINKINDKINIHTIKRIDNNYFDKEVNETNIVSATSIRELINKGDDIRNYIPSYSYDFIKYDVAMQNLFLFYKYSVNINPSKIKDYALVSEGIENRLISFLDDETYDKYINDVMTKRYTQNRIQRIILSIIFNISKKYENNNSIIDYNRILGINDIGLKYIKKKIKNDNFKCIMNTKDAYDNFNKDILDILDIELKATKIYDLVSEKNTYKNEYILQVKK